MTKYFSNNFPIVNIYKKASTKSEIVTQIIYGDSFSIYQKKKNGLKLKLKKIITKVIYKKKNFLNI